MNENSSVLPNTFQKPSFRPYYDHPPNAQIAQGSRVLTDFLVFRAFVTSVPERLPHTLGSIVSVLFHLTCSNADDTRWVRRREHTDQVLSLLQDLPWLPQ